MRQTPRRCTRLLPFAAIPYLAPCNSDSIQSESFTCHGSSSMCPSNESSRCRSAAELRLAFKTMTAHHLPRVTALEVFDNLWDEVNRAASVVMPATAALAEYIALLKEMQNWYDDVLKGPA
jgi:hypothetical protein